MDHFIRLFREVWVIQFMHGTTDTGWDHCLDFPRKKLKGLPIVHDDDLTQKVEEYLHLLDKNFLMAYI